MMFGLAPYLPVLGGVGQITDIPDGAWLWSAGNPVMYSLPNGFVEYA